MLQEKLIGVSCLFLLLCLILCNHFVYLAMKLSEMAMLLSIDLSFVCDMVLYREPNFAWQHSN